MESKKIRILVIDDHVVFRKALIHLLNEKADNCVVVGQASYYTDALELLRTVHCDLVLLDFSLDSHSGLEIIEAAKSEGIEARFVILTGHMSQLHVQRSLAAGAKGYLLKDDVMGILEAIPRIVKGEIYINQSLRDEGSSQDKVS